MRPGPAARPSGACAVRPSYGGGHGRGDGAGGRRAAPCGCRIRTRCTSPSAASPSWTSPATTWPSATASSAPCATGPPPWSAIPTASTGESFFQKRAPKNLPDWIPTARIAFPSGRYADEICPTETAAVLWAANLGTLTFHPWPVRRGDVDHPDELRIDLDPQPGTDYADAVRAAHDCARSWTSWGCAAGPRPRAAGGCTSSCRSNRAGRFAAGTAVRHRHRP